MNPDDETTLSEITIMPDGRLYVFGASREVLDVLAELSPGDADLQRRVQHVRTTADRAAAPRECAAPLIPVLSRRKRGFSEPEESKP